MVVVVSMISVTVVQNNAHSIKGQFYVKVTVYFKSLEGFIRCVVVERMRHASEQGEPRSNAVCQLHSLVKAVVALVRGTWSFEAIHNQQIQVSQQGFCFRWNIRAIANIRNVLAQLVA